MAGPGRTPESFFTRATSAPSFGTGTSEPTRQANGRELTGQDEPSKVEGLPRRGWDGSSGSVGVRRLFENSTVCLIVNAKYFESLVDFFGSD